MRIRRCYKISIYNIFYLLRFCFEWIWYFITFIISTLLTAVLGTTAQAKTIHSERSLYRNILVEEKRGLRCLKFNVRSSKTQQSCMLVDDPQRLVFNYTKMLFSSFFGIIKTFPKWWMVRFSCTVGDIMYQRLKHDLGGISCWSPACSFPCISKQK